MPSAKKIKLSYIVAIVISVWQVVFAALAFLILRPSEHAIGRDRPTLGDLGTVLFGASSIALIILSLVAAWAAIIGWQSLKQSVQKDVELGLEKKLERIEIETKGRFASVFGHTLGRLSTKPTEWEPSDPERWEQLREAVQQCQKGYDLLETSDDKLKFMSLNNLVYYASILGSVECAGHILEQARLLRGMGQKRNSPRLMLTYCRAVLRFSSDPIELAEGKGIAFALGKEAADASHRNVAQYYAKLFEIKVQEIPADRYFRWSPNGLEAEAAEAKLASCQ